MKIIRLLSLIVGFALLAGTVSAQQAGGDSFAGDGSGQWNLGLGASYRHFRDARFQGVNSGNYVGLFQDSAANMKPFASEIGKYTSNDPVPVNVVTYSGGSARASGDYGCEESLGIILGANYGLWQDGRLNLDFVANLQYFHIDTAGRGKAGFERTTNVYAAGGQVSYNDVYQSTNYISSYSKTKFDLKLYVIDLGVSLDYTFENGLGVFAATGPSLSIADMESSSRASLINTSAGNSKVGGARGRDNEIEFEWGWYVAAGASYWFNEQYGLSCELRYDEAWGTVGTKYVKQDLDAWGGNVKLLFRF